MGRDEIPRERRISWDPEIRESKSDLRAMDVALGLAHARTDTVDGDGPLIEGDIRRSFATRLRRWPRQADGVPRPSIQSIFGPRRGTSPRLPSRSRRHPRCSTRLSQRTHSAFGAPRSGWASETTRLKGLIWALSSKRAPRNFMTSARWQKVRRGGKIWEGIPVGRIS